MRKRLLLFFAAAIIVTFTAFAYFNLNCNFNGKVGTYPVTGGLELGTTGEVWGRYGYKKNGQKPKAWLDLEGEYDTMSGTKYRLTMTESSNGKVTGTWDVIYDSSRRTMTGTMKTNGKTYKVNITTSRADIMN